MIITKVINNNVVSSHDEKGIEVIVMEKGVGFQKKAKLKKFFIYLMSCRINLPN